MTDALNEQVLWFTRRLVALERALDDERQRAERAEGRARSEAQLADQFAQQMRDLARDDPALSKRVAFDANNDEERDAAMRDNRWNDLPLHVWRRRRAESYPAYRHVPIDPFEDEPWP